MISRRLSRVEVRILSEWFARNLWRMKVLIGLMIFRRKCWFMAQELKVVAIPPSEVRTDPGSGRGATC